MWPWTETNRELFYRHGSCRSRFTTLGLNLQHPQLVLLDPDHALYLPPGTFHAVLTIKSCFLPSILLYDCSAISHVVTTILGEWSTGMAHPRMLDGFARVAMIIMEREVKERYGDLIQAWEESRFIFERIARGERGPGVFTHEPEVGFELWSPSFCTNLDQLRSAP